MLVVFLLLQVVFGIDIGMTPSDKEIFEIDMTQPCPDEGYFFQRDVAVFPKKPRCFMCFCSVEPHATCHERSLERCDTEKYHHHHHHVGRRSPVALDILSSLMENLMEYSYAAAENLIEDP